MGVLTHNEETPEQRARRTINIGFVGAGIIASVHLPNLRQLPGVRIAAVCDVDEQLARAVAIEHGARPYTEAERMIGEAELDALFICVPPFARGRIIERAVERGLHLYIEKPLALDLHTAQRTLGVVEASGVIASVGYMWRYAPVAERARAALKDAREALLLGRMLNGPPTAAWSFDQSLSGGILVEFATHMVDLLRYLGGEISEVSGKGVEVRRGTPTRGFDSAVLALQYESGAVGSLEVSWALDGAIWDVRAITRETQLELTLNPERLIGHWRGERIEIVGEHLAGAHGFGGSSWYLAVQAFVEAVRSNNATLVRSSYRDGTRTLALTLAANEALRTNGVVRVAPVQRL